MANLSNLVQEFEELLGSKKYFTISNLVKLGLFGSSSGGYEALKRKSLPSIKISPKRTLIPRSAVLEYFKENMCIE